MLKETSCRREGRKERRKEALQEGKQAVSALLSHCCHTLLCGAAALHAGSCGVTVGPLNLLLLQVWFVCL